MHPQEIGISRMTKKIDRISPANLNRWRDHIEKYRLPIAKRAMQLVHFAGEGLELGAGTCWFSSVLTRSRDVVHITAIDVDADRLALAKSSFLPAFRGVDHKIDFFVGDYHRLAFPDSTFDFVIADASLHHTANLPCLLSEIQRIMKATGVLVAIREPILPSFAPLRTWRRLTFGWRERREGATERTYTRDEWQHFFGEAGFQLEAFECFPTTTLKEKLVYLLRRYNGYLFSRFFFIARPSQCDSNNPHPNISNVLALSKETDSLQRASSSTDSLI